MSRAVRVSTVQHSWGDDDTGCNFMHLDMDSFFASVELLEHPELVGKPAIVGGLSARSVVTTATYEAREFGIHAGMPMNAARRLCPQAVILPTRHEVYRKMSARVMQILGQITPELEQVSIDEAFLGIEGARRRLGSAVQIGELARRRIYEELGLKATVGIAAVKFVSKIASTQAKPDGLLLIPKSETVQFLHELPVGALWGVGSRTQEILRKIGIDWVRELAQAEMPRLERALGVASARKLSELSRGIDRRGIVTGVVEKSVSHEQTFESNLRQRSEVEPVMLSQSHKVAASLRRKGLVASGVSIKIRSGSFHTLTRSMKLPTATDTAREIYSAARSLFESIPIPAEGIRLVGVKAERLSLATDGVQAMFNEDLRQHKIESVLDEVHKRFGDAAVSVATLLPPRSGGDTNGYES